VEWLPRSGAFTGSEELGNLARPLDWRQAAGIWPAGDFRDAPDDPLAADVLIAIAAAAAVLGLWFAWRRRGAGILVYATAALAGGLAFGLAGSPWIAGKAFAAASPVLLVLAFTGCAALAGRGRRVEAGVLATVLAGGVAWSNALAYRSVSLAPTSRLVELERIGKQFAGQGPALMTEYEPYGARHFLRRLDAEGASELRRRIVPLRSGAPVDPQVFADLDQFRLDGVLVYRTLVLRRSPTESRPPSIYRLAWRGRWYEVWQRAGRGAATIAAHLPLGGDLDPAAVPSCAAVLRLAALPRVSRLVAAVQPPVATSAAALDPDRSRTIDTSLTVAGAGRATLWLGGSFPGSVSAAIDGRRIGSDRHELEWPGGFVPLGDVILRPGAHRVELRYAVGGLRPGAAGASPFGAGPIVLTSDRAARLVSARRTDARSLCGRRLDWVEALSG
jgi:hypothetical protein